MDFGDLYHLQMLPRLFILYTIKERLWALFFSYLSFLSKNFWYIIICPQKTCVRFISLRKCPIPLELQHQQNGLMFSPKRANVNCMTSELWSAGIFSKGRRWVHQGTRWVHQAHSDWAAAVHWSAGYTCKLHLLTAMQRRELSLLGCLFVLLNKKGPLRITSDFHLVAVQNTLL